MLLRCLLAGVGGVLLSMASEPVGLAVLTPVAVAALVYAVGHDPRRAWAPGLAFGAGFMFVLLGWMRAVGLDAWLILSLVQTAYFAPLGVGLAWVTRLRWWPVWQAALWVAVETVRGTWPMGGLPWGRLSYTVADTVWAAGLPWVGFTGVSLLLALTGTTLAWLVTQRPPALRAGAALAGLAALTLAPTLVQWDPDPGDEILVAVVQGDVPGSGENLVAVHREVTANHVQATLDLAQQVAEGSVPAPDLVIWPENSTAVDPFRDVEVHQGIESASQAIGAPILVGAMADSVREQDVLNQGIVWVPGLGGTDRFTKHHPVPFGEYIPWRNGLITGNFGKLRMIPRDMLSGTRVEPLRIPGRTQVRLADAICFDIAYDDVIHAQVRAGAELLAVQTSNAMFIHTPQIDQQFEITRLRALETGRQVAVAATNGISGVIAADGTVQAQAEPQTTTVLVERVALSSRITPAVRLGPWPGRLFCAVALVGCVLAWRRPSRAPTGRI